MDYNLAQQLKEAGFSQDIKQIELCIYADMSSEPCKIPTLSELIEACGDKEFYLTHTYDDKGKITIWRCSYDDTDDCNIDCCGSEAEGSTPEEAVAKLWLEINK